jgi:hypothetical protein
MVTVLEGDPGVGKSFALLDLVARFTRRSEWPDGTPQRETPAGAPHPEVLAPKVLVPEVLVLGRKDDFPANSRRLAGMEADLSRVHWWRHFDTFESENSQPAVRSVELVNDMPAVVHELNERPAIRLVVIDSLADLCRRPRDVEEALRQLDALAKSRHLAIVVTLPARCRFDAQGALRVTSRFRTEASRNVWCVAADPIDARQLLFLPRRVNFYDEPTGLPFRVVHGRVDWAKAYRLDRHDPLHYWKSLENFLKWKLRDGPVRSTEIYGDGSEMGFSPKQLRLAGLRLRIQIRKAGGFASDGCWLWYTPAQWLDLANRASSEDPGDAKNGESLEKAAENEVGANAAVCENGHAQAPLEIVAVTRFDAAKNEESLANRGKLRASLAASVFGGRNQFPVGTAVVSSTEQAKIAESMEKYGGMFNRILGEMRGDQQPALATAATTADDSPLPAWKRPRKKR